MGRVWLLGTVLPVLAFLLAACDYPALNPVVPTATPNSAYKLREIITADVTTCEPQTVSGDSMVKTIFGSNLLTFVVTGAEGDNCLFDFSNDVGTGHQVWTCRVPRSLGKVTVFEFDKGVTDFHGYRYGHQFSWDLGGQCTLAECSEGTILPADCARR
jgi:hypothetical protein